VKAIEEVVENKVEEKSVAFEKIVNKDISILRGDMKEDMAKLRGEFKEDMAKQKGELTTAIAESKTEMIRWMFIFWASQLGAIFAFLKFFK
jgi:hypothetical protein